jgi:predicted metal-dependent phosphoesterase TrpH
MYLTDLHTHSIASYDGGITLKQYKKCLEAGALNYIAITDHNRIDFALRAQNQLGEKIIVGEEIMTNQGEVIGLYLKKVIPPGLELLEAIELIKEQKGLVYAPHPFETIRKGVQEEDLLKVIDKVDIIEAFNGRAFAQNNSEKVLVFAKGHNLPCAASSDAHGLKGLSKTYMALSNVPTAENLTRLITSGKITYTKPGFRAILYPSYNKLLKTVRRKTH